MSAPALPVKAPPHPFRFTLAAGRCSSRGLRANERARRKSRSNSCPSVWNDAEDAELPGKHPRANQPTARRVEEDDLYRPSGSFRFEFHDPADDSFAPASFLASSRVRGHFLQPRHQVPLRHGNLVAHPDRADAVHEIDGLAALQPEQGLDVAAAEEGIGLGLLASARTEVSL
jgi:hypothetical protein